MTLQKRIPAGDAVPLEKADSPASAIANVFNINDVMRILRTRWHIVLGSTLIALAIVSVVVIAGRRLGFIGGPTPGYGPSAAGKGL